MKSIMSKGVFELDGL